MPIARVTRSLAGCCGDQCERVLSDETRPEQPFISRMNRPVRDIVAGLPAAYEFEWLDKIDCLRDSARERAEQGATEGTLLVTGELESGAGIAGKHWQGFQDNLHAAIVLQPNIAESRYHEYLVVALVSLGNAISGVVSPMTALTYSWPNDINIARLKIASVWMDHGVTTESGSPWLTISVSANVAHAPEDFSLPAMSLHEAEGNKEITRDNLLVAWARQFVVQLNDWSEKGFEHTRAFWKARLDTDDRLLDMMTDSGNVQVKLVEVDQDGSAVVMQTDNAPCKTLSLGQYITNM